MSSRSFEPERGLATHFVQRPNDLSHFQQKATRPVVGAVQFQLKTTQVNALLQSLEATSLQDLFRVGGGLHAGYCRPELDADDAVVVGDHSG